MSTTKFKLLEMLAHGNNFPHHDKTTRIRIVHRSCHALTILLPRIDRGEANIKKVRRDMGAGSPRSPAGAWPKHPFHLFLGGVTETRRQTLTPWREIAHGADGEMQVADPRRGKLGGVFEFVKSTESW